MHGRSVGSYEDGAEQLQAIAKRRVPEVEPLLPVDGLGTDVFLPV